LQSLKWLDLKDNPLELTLAKAAGDCLDEKQCKQCASRVSLSGQKQKCQKSLLNCINKYFELCPGSAAHEGTAGRSRKGTRTSIVER